MILFIPACVLLMVVVLVQQGKESGFVGAFGAGGGSQTIFGTRRGDVLSKATWILGGACAVVLLLLSIFPSGSGSDLEGPRPVMNFEPASPTFDDGMTLDQALQNLPGDATSQSAEDNAAASNPDSSEQTGDQPAG